MRVPNSVRCPPWGGGGGRLWVLRSRAMWTEGSALPFREAIPAAAWTVCRTGGDSGWRVAMAGRTRRTMAPQVPTPNTCSFSPNTIPRGLPGLAFFSDLNPQSEESVCLSRKDLEGPRTRRRVGRGGDPPRPVEGVRRWGRGGVPEPQMLRNGGGRAGQQAGLLLARGGLALAAGTPVITQVLLIGVQVLLQAEGYRLVTGAQLLLAPAPLIRCRWRRTELSVYSFPKQSSGWP